VLEEDGFVRARNTGALEKGGSQKMFLTPLEQRRVMSGAGEMRVQIPSTNPLN